MFFFTYYKKQGVLQSYMVVKYISENNGVKLIHTQTQTVGCPNNCIFKVGGADELVNASVLKKFN